MLLLINVVFDLAVYMSPPFVFFRVVSIGRMMFCAVALATQHPASVILKRAVDSGFPLVVVWILPSLRASRSVVYCT